MTENKLFEALLDVIPFAAYAVDINTYEVVYANKLMQESMYAPREEFCWKKLFGQEEVCSWCTIPKLKEREVLYKSEKLLTTFFDEVTDSWLQSYDEIVKWPDGRTVKYSISVDITEQKEIQADMIKTHTKLAIQSKKLKEANAKLEMMAQKDFLTGINNRRNFFDLTEKLWDSKLKSEDNIYIAMMDIDDFKLLNDNYSHKAGDEVLVMFTKTVVLNLDDSDIFGRLGGEEFAIVMTDSCKNNVISKLDRIKNDIEALNILHDEQSIKCTVSIGLSSKEDDTQTIDQVLDDADKQMYLAKKQGKNRIKFRI
ncbi:MAG: GGDEF domain-containing protein [Campylobacterota bacterium]|nr:GGDEF domain-containing protein [Campylobacterota bacterium]